MRHTTFFVSILVVLILSACHTYQTNNPSPQKVKTVETENIQWNKTAEEAQELSDEI